MPFEGGRYSTVGAFKKDLETASVKLKEDVKTTTAIVMAELYNRFVDKTPIGEEGIDPHPGLTRDSWRTTLGSPSGGGNRAKASAAQFKLQISDPFGKQFIWNNVPWILKLEFGGYPKNPVGGRDRTVNGYSRQAPQGIVRVTMAEVSSRIRSLVHAGL